MSISLTSSDRKYSVMERSVRCGTLADDVVRLKSCDERTM